PWIVLPIPLGLATVSSLGLVNPSLMPDRAEKSPLLAVGQSSGDFPLPPVLLAGRLAPPDVPLRLVPLQDPLHPEGQLRIHPREALSDIFMHGGLADAEDAGRLPHRRVGVDDVGADLQNPFPDVLPHRRAPSPPPVVHVYVGRR